MVNDGGLKVGADPLHIPNAIGQSQSLGTRIILIEGGMMNSCHT